MFFAWDITIPAGRSETNPLEQTLKLGPGVITRVDVKFPAGCHGLAKVRLFHEEFQLVPLSRGEWVTGDDEAVRADMYFDLTRKLTHLKFRGACAGSTYAHTVTVRVTVLPVKVASMVPVLELLTRLLQRMGVMV